MAPQYSNEHGNRVPVAVVHHENLISHADGHGSLLRKDPYGTPVERAAAVAAGAGHERHRGILHRSGSSSSSSSSSSEGDGQGGRRKKSSLTGKIKEKLPGGRKNGVGQTAKPSGGFRHTVALGATTTTTTTTATANGGPREKKGFMEKIKEKLPGHH